MKHRLNVKAVAILLVSFAVLSVSVYFLHRFQVKRNAHGVLEQASLVEQDGQLARAAGYLEQYLGLAPGDNEALARLGVLLDKLAKTPRARVRALIVLEQTLRHDSSRKDVRRVVARLAMTLGRYRDAVHHLNLLMKDAPEDAELLHWRGRCSIGEFNYPEAEEWYGKALKIAPDRIDVSVEFAGLLRTRMQMTAEANGQIEAMLRMNEQSPDAQIKGAQYFRHFGQLEQAEKHVQFAMEKLGSQDAEVLLLAADIARARGNPADARKHLERGRQLHPKDTRLGRAQAQLDLADGDRARALRCLQESQSQAPDDPDELWSLAVLYLESGDTKKAEALGKRLGQLGAIAPMQCVQAQILMNRQAWGEARQALEKVQAGKRWSRELARQVPFLLAVCYERLANPDQRLTAYQRAVDADPNWPAARRGLALSLLALGKTDQAIVELRKAVPQAPSMRGELVQLLIARNGRLPAAQQSWDEVEKLLKELAQTADSNASLQILRAQVLAAQGKLDQAQKMMEEQRKSNPQQPAPWLFLAGLAQSQAKTDAILPLLDEAERQAGRRVDWYLARAQFWARAGGKEAPDRLRQLETSLEKFNERDRLRLLQALAEAFDILGDAAAAEAYWRQLALGLPNDLAVRVRMLERTLRPDKEAETQSLLAEIRRIEGDDGPVTQFGEAAQLIRQTKSDDAHRLTKARALLAKVAELRPSWTWVPLLEGDAFDQENRKDRALEKYQAALDRGEGRLSVIRRVLQLLAEQQRYTEAQALIRKLPERAMAARDLSQMAAALSLVGTAGEQGKEHALDLARKAAADNPKEYRDQLWLGQVASSVGKMEEAEKAFRQARQLDDTAPITWVALIQFLAPRDPKKADAELAAAQVKLAKNQLPAVLAAAHEALGRTQDAEEQYLAILGAKPGDTQALFRAASFYIRTSQLAKAEPLLRKLFDPKLAAPPEAAAWARRELALHLASRGGYPLFREAVALLDANVAKGQEKLEDRRARSLVLASQPAHRREAIAILEKLPHQGSAGSPIGQYLLAQLVDRDGNWPRARALMTDLLSEQGKNPLFVAAFVRSLLRHKESDAAASWVAKLAELAPRAFETTELRARVLKERGKLPEAAALIKSYVQEKDARLDLAAVLLDQLGQADEAEALYRRVAATSKRPEAVLVLARQLSRRHQSEALNLCEQAWKSCPAEQVALASVVVLRAGNANDEQLARVEGWLKDAMAKNANSPMIAVAYAEIQDVRGRHDDAIRLYRKALGQNPNDVVATNNLAYLLAMTEGKSAEALALAERSIELAGPDPELLDTRALVRMKSGNVEGAIKDLNQAIVQAPTAAMYFHLAQAQQLAKNQQAAAAAFRQAMDFGLQVATLPRLERPACEQMVAALKKY